MNIQLEIHHFSHSIQESINFMAELVGKPAAPLDEEYFKCLQTVYVEDCEVIDVDLDDVSIVSFSVHWPAHNQRHCEAILSQEGLDHIEAAVTVKLDDEVGECFDRLTGINSSSLDFLEIKV